MRRRAAILAGLGATAALVWLAGFVWFVHRASIVFEPPERADGIVALTGGAGRVETALQLLAAGRARLALVSGTGGGAELGELAARAGVDPGRIIGRVTLGRHAMSTRGNAAEAAAWARANGLRSLIVVTSGYHMPRALTEIGQAVPEATLYPVPVMPPGMQAPGGLRDAGMVRLMAAEYTKWLAARLGLSGLGPHEGLSGQDAHASAAG